MYIISHCFICQPSDSDVLEDAGIKPRTVWDWQSDALTTRIDLIHSRLCSSHPLLGQFHPLLGWISSTDSARSHLQTQLDLTTTRLDLNHYSASSHPLTRLDLIHCLDYRSHLLLGYILSAARLDLIHCLGYSSHLLLGQISCTDGQISSSTWLDLIHYSARSHQHLDQMSSTTWINLIHSRLDIIHYRLDLIHCFARSRPLLGCLHPQTY